MIRNPLPFIAFAALTTCGAPPAAETAQSPNVAAAAPKTASKPPAHSGGGPRPRPDLPADCPLVISFGSYAMGIDYETLRRVDALLEADPGVNGVTRSHWGREGEVTLCAAVRGDADRDRLFAAVSALFPQRPRGPLAVETDDGRSFAANNAMP